MNLTSDASNVDDWPVLSNIGTDILERGSSDVTHGCPPRDVAGSARPPRQLNNTSLAYSVSTYSRTVRTLPFFTSNIQITPCSRSDTISFSESPSNLP